ncbi:MAG: alpha/beta hydrolase [Cyanobacteria bacterium P01_H01_bin.121]
MMSGLRVSVSNKTAHATTSCEQQRFRWGQRLRSLCTSVLLATAGAVGVMAAPVEAAENIRLQYGGLLDLTLPLESIEQFATTGDITNQEASDNIQLLLDVAPSNLNETEIKNFLTGEIPVDASIADTALKTYLAEVLLKELSTIIDPQSAGTMAWQDWATALTTAAQDGSVSVLEVLQVYQPATIDIDAQNAINVIQRLETDAKNVEQVVQSQLGISFSNSGDPLNVLRSLICNCQ